MATVKGMLINPCLHVCAALVRSTMEALQHKDHLGVHLKVSKWIVPLKSFSGIIVSVVMVRGFLYLCSIMDAKIVLLPWEPDTRRCT